MTTYPIIHPVIVPIPAGLESVNFYIVETGQKIVLVDAGIDTDECWDCFEQVLRENEWKIKDIDQIILTHNHNDHTGLVNRIRTMKDLPVYAHPEAIVRLRREREFMKDRIAFFNRLYQEMGSGEKGMKQIEKLKQSMKENEGEAIKGAIYTIAEGDNIAGFRVLEVPGHAPDHIALFHADSGILLGGDLLMKHIRPNALVEQDQQGCRLPSLINYYESLKKCLDYPLSVIYTGHGDAVENPHALIEQRLQEIENKSEKIKNMIEETPLTAAQIAQLYYKKKYETEFSLVMSQIIGHLDRLESLGEVTAERKDGVWYYSVVSP